MTDPYVPGHGDASYDVAHYDLVLRYKPVGNRLDGEAMLVLRRDDGPHGPSCSTSMGSGGEGAASTARPPRGTRHRSGRLGGRSPDRGRRRFTVRVKYAGSPGTVSSRALGDAGWEELADGVIVAAQPHGAPSWFPCNDRPDNKATYAIDDRRAAGLPRRGQR